MAFEEKEKSSWINLAKICCMGGVLLQHVRGYVYTNDYIFYSVWWVVALFVMIGGYNSMSSYLNRGEILVKKRISNLFWPYLLATILYLFREYRFLDVSELFRRLIHFNASTPLYYVSVYMQLIMVTPVLVGLIRWCDQKCRLGRYMAVWFFILLVCYGTVHFTNLFDIVIGGGNLFAGPWLFFWFLGMFIKSMKFRWKGRLLRICTFVVYTVCLVIWQYLFVFRSWNSKLSPIFHGSQVGMTWANAVEAVILFFWFKELLEVFEVIAGKAGKCILRPVNFLGQHTLYIFLYHMLFLDIYKSYLELDGAANGWVCMVFIFLGPVLLEGIVGRLKKFCRKIMQGVKVA